MVLASVIVYLRNAFVVLLQFDDQFGDGVVRCDSDGAFLWSRTFKTAAEYRAELQRLEQDFLARGWTVAP